MELTPELQAMVITLGNALVTLVGFKVKSIIARANAKEARAKEVIAALRQAISDDGEINKKECERIIRAFERYEGA